MRRLATLLALVMLELCPQIAESAQLTLRQAQGERKNSEHGTKSAQAEPVEAGQASRIRIVEHSRVAAAEAGSAAAQFVTVDVIVDAGAESLAAYQIEIIASGDAKIVGVEGGDHAAFNPAPYYDPAALQGGRIIIAAFSTGTSLPSGRTRVAVLQMREVGTVTYRVRLLAAARADGSRFTPAVSVTGGQR